ncbi:ABC transporter substrate-binding protein [Streptomyces sp. NPDC053048]|uniref:ABC transporter substrate-binding protein n=1 Tax=Streptomyces sp. NPDC053048 TaxID=3365694 RepID=UPI0037D6B1CC
MRGVRIRVGTTVLAAALLVGSVGGCGVLEGGGSGQGPITVGTTDTVSALDPAGAYDAGSWALYSNIYQSLLTFSPGSSAPVPDAARRCGFEGEGLRTYVCELRPGLTFANGHALTAEDVKFSFDRIVRIRSKQGPLSLLETLRSVDASAAGDKVTFRLKVPDATFPFKIATGGGSIVDSETYPANRLRAGDEVDGSGPFVLSGYTTGATAELKPNKRYQGVMKRAGSEVTVRYFADPGRLSQAWQDKSLDVVGRQLPPADLAGLSPTETAFRVSETPAANMRALVFNLRDGSPMRTTAVRQAIAAIVDRSALARDVHLRTVEPLYSLIPQGLTGHTTSFYDTYPNPDPEQAAGLLRRAGVSVPVRFGLAYSRGAATDQEAALLKKQLEATGLFRVETRHVGWKEFQEGYARGAYDAYTISWVADFPDPDTFTTPLVGAGNALHTGYTSPRIESLIRATQQMDQRARVSPDFRSIQKIVAEDVPLVPLWQKKDYAVSRKSISGTQYLSDGTGMWRLWRLKRM